MFRFGLLPKEGDGLLGWRLSIICVMFLRIVLRLGAFCFIDTQLISSTARVTITMEVIATQSSVISTSCPQLRCTLMDCCGHFLASRESDDLSRVKSASASTVESEAISYSNG